jgi:hypothetical protein
MAEIKKVVCELLVEDKKFTNKETGEVIEYKDVVAVIDGVHVKISIKQDSKQLFNYLLSKV